MKKLLSVILACSALFLFAQDKMFVNSNGDAYGVNINEISAISFDETNEILEVQAANTLQFAFSTFESITFSDADDVVYITFNGSDATIVNPLAFQGVSITKEGAHVTVNSTYGSEVEYHLSGTSTDGAFKIYTAKKSIVTLDNLTLTNASGAAINCQSDKKMTLNLLEGTTNTLTDAAKYTTVDGEDMKGTLFSEGKIDINGSGSLNVVGLKKHGIVSDDDIIINNGNILMTNVASDAFHCNGLFQLNGGTVNVAATGDGIDGDEGNIEINGGTLGITVATDATKGIKCDGTFTMTDGSVTITTTGNVVVTDGDTSYCTAIKAGGIIDITGGTLNITSSGEAGKGISGDSTVKIEGGDITITTTGGGAKYTTTDNVIDSYSATCIKSDTDIEILGGSITTNCSGLAGKGISADGTLTIGDGTSAPTLNITTTGARFLVSGSGNNADYANPKAIKAIGDLTINSGNITVKTTQTGGEGIESKSTLTINGGSINITAADDGINAASAIVINGGETYTYSTENDGLDSNGTLTVTGGVVISSGTNTPEEGFDCDQNTFKITGGILIGTGGATSTPTSSVCTQRSVIYTTSGSANSLIHIQDASGNDILTYMIPRSYSQMTLLFSAPSLASGTTYSIYTGGSVSGGTTFQGYTSGGTYTPGTQATTFTPSSMVTTIGGGGNRPGGRP